LSEADFKEYQTYYFTMTWEKVPAPDLLVYLMADDKVLLERAKASARKFEAVDGEYFLALKKVNRSWLKKVKSIWQVLEIDTNKVNFAGKGEGQTRLIEEVMGKIKSIRKKY
jgi:deoxyadenosine/deoxycytidine kinase